MEKPADLLEKRLKVVGCGRMERIPEKEFDRSPHFMADGWRVVARKNGYVYIANGEMGF